MEVVGRRCHIWGVLVGVGSMWELWVGTHGMWAQTAGVGDAWGHWQHVGVVGRLLQHVGSHRVGIQCIGLGTHDAGGCGWTVCGICVISGLCTRSVQLWISEVVSYILNKDCPSTSNRTEGLRPSVPLPVESPR